MCKTTESSALKKYYLSSNELLFYWVRDMVEKEADIVEQKFGFFVTKRIDKKTKKMQVQLRTKGEGMPLAEAVIILEGWIQKVKEELQKPYTRNLRFGRK